MAHPFADLLRDRRIGALWGGLAFSAFGNELGRIAMVWLAIGVVGADAGFLPMAQNAVVLIVSLGAGLISHRLSPRLTMIGVDMASAVIAVAPVVVALIWGVTFWSLVASAMCLAALSALFQPALYSSVPHIAGTPERMQGVNALFDATTRMSRLLGPFAAGPLSAVVPVIHFLTVNALSFIASGLAILSLGRTIDPPPQPQDTMSAGQRLIRGIRIVSAQPVARTMLIANALVLAAWMVGVSLGLPFLVAEYGVSGLGLHGLGAVAALVAAYGAGDFLSNLFVAGHRPRRLGPFMYGGYFLLGAGLALVPLPLWLLPEAMRLPTMMIAAFASGLGGPLFFIPMMTYLQTNLAGQDLVSVIRLRLAVIAGAMMIGSGLAPMLYTHLGAGPAVVAAGMFIAAAAIWGLAKTRS